MNRTNIEGVLTELDAATAYAVAWNHLDCTQFLELLAPETQYASQWVLDELKSKAAISEYWPSPKLCTSLNERI